MYLSQDIPVLSFDRVSLIQPFLSEVLTILFGFAFGLLMWPCLDMLLLYICLICGVFFFTACLLVVEVLPPEG